LSIFLPCLSILTDNEWQTNATLSRLGKNSDKTRTKSVIPETRREEGKSNEKTNTKRVNEGSASNKSENDGGNNREQVLQRKARDPVLLLLLLQ
jgi:hypothetical protein